MSRPREDRFRYEEEMKPPVLRWLLRRGFLVREEFDTAYGTCDLVGCILDPGRVQARKELRQRRALGPLRRIHVWLQVPDESENRGVAFDELFQVYRGFVDETVIRADLSALIRDRFLRILSDGRFQKVNGWFPLQTTLVAIELKLRRVDDAIAQAERYRAFADVAYVALPQELAVRLAASEEFPRLTRAGIGVLGVSARSVRTFDPSPERAPDEFDPAARTHAVERFFTRVAIGN